jgi:hypothetical protein
VLVRCSSLLGRLPEAFENALHTFQGASPVVLLNKCPFSKKFPTEVSVTASLFLIHSPEAHCFKIFLCAKESTSSFGDEVRAFLDRD